MKTKKQQESAQTAARNAAVIEAEKQALWASQNRPTLEAEAKNLFAGAHAASGDLSRFTHIVSRRALYRDFGFTSLRAYLLATFNVKADDAKTVENWWGNIRRRYETSIGWGASLKGSKGVKSDADKAADYIKKITAKMTPANVFKLAEMLKSIYDAKVKAEAEAKAKAEAEAEAPKAPKVKAA